jgi:hypothetical protein
MFYGLKIMMLFDEHNQLDLVDVGGGLDPVLAMTVHKDLKLAR